MNTKGYIVLDTLGALSIVLFAALVLLPIFASLKEDREEIQMELQAQHILYEKLQQYTLQTSIPSLYTERRKDTAFHYTLQTFEKNALYMKGCVSFETSREKKVTFCDVVKAK